MKTWVPDHPWLSKFLLGTALLIVACILYNVTAVWGFLGKLVGFVSPFLMGGAIAFVLNIPMQFIESHLFQGEKFKTETWCKVRRMLALILTLLAAVLIIAVILLGLIPQLITSVKQIVNKDNFFKIVDLIQTNLQNYPEVKDKLMEIAAGWQAQISSLLGTLSERAQDIVGTGFRVVGGFLTGIINFVIGLVFAIYILIDKERLGRQSKRILYAFLPERAYQMTLKISALSYKTFAEFITGQCTDAMILGVMFLIAMLILQLPYAVLVSVIIAVFALIPVVGAFIACAVGMIFIGLDTPIKALVFFILFQVLQQIDNNLIYPHVVGNSVGLPGMWVLFAITVGGAMWGAIGMLVGIPIMSVLYTLLGEATRARLTAKHAPEELTAPEPPAHAPKPKAKKKPRKSAPEPADASEQTPQKQKAVKQANKK